MTDQAAQTSPQTDDGVSAAAAAAADAAAKRVAMDRMAVRDRSMRQTFNALLKLLKPDVICDVGALDGTESATFRKLRPDADVVLFEASRANIEDFISTRSDLPRVRIENAAVSDRDGITTFFEVRNVAGRNEWTRGAGSLGSRLDEIESDPVAVRSVRLDTYFAEELAAQKTFALWLDVEGALEQVFGGAERVLSRTLFLRTEVEHRAFWENQLLASQVVERLSGAGFSLLDDTYTPGALEQSDILMINNRMLAI